MTILRKFHHLKVHLWLLFSMKVHSQIWPGFGLLNSTTIRCRTAGRYDTEQSPVQNSKQEMSPQSHSETQDMVLLVEDLSPIISSGEQQGIDIIFPQPDNALLEI